MAMLLLGLLLTAGIALRVALALAYEPAVLSQTDSATYVLQAREGLFESYYAAPGYSFFLRVAHLLSADLAVTIALQHLIGCVTAVVLWWGVYRATGSKWPGLVPAAVVLLSGDSLFIEHAVATESVFLLLVAGAVAAALGAADTERPQRWLLAAGVLLGLAVWVRFVALALALVLALWALLALRGRASHRIATAGMVLGPAVLLIALMVIMQGMQTGHYRLNESSGWASYSRVAGFADCDRFTPPPGTEGLCESRPPAARRHPDWYAWSPASPARKVFKRPPRGNALLAEWARSAMVAQPLDYVDAVASDFALFFAEEDWVDRDRSLLGPRSISFALRTPDENCPPDTCRQPVAGIENANRVALTDPEHGAYYDSFSLSIGPAVAFFQDYQEIARPHAWLIATLTAVALLGLAGASSRATRAHQLCLAAGLSLLVLPVATATYNVRYALPAVPLLAAAAALTPLVLRAGPIWSARDPDRAAAAS
jgi:hypothetical protein